MVVLGEMTVIGKPASQSDPSYRRTGFSLDQHPTRVLQPEPSDVNGEGLAAGLEETVDAPAAHAVTRGDLLGVEPLIPVLANEFQNIAHRLGSRREIYGFVAGDVDRCADKIGHLSGCVVQAGRKPP